LSRPALSNLLRLLPFAASLILAAPAHADEGGRFHSDIGLSFISGQQKITDALNADATAMGATFSSKALPVGAEWYPYYLFDSGLGIGGSVGPIQLLSINSMGGASGGTSFVLPVGLDLRYHVLGLGSVTPYLRAGFRDPLTSGNNLKNGKAGLYGAVGMEVPGAHFGFEVAFDQSKVDVVYGPYTTTVKPYQTTVSVFAHF
jgi:hypothetical protein